MTFQIQDILTGHFFFSRVYLSVLFSHSFGWNYPGRCPASSSAAKSDGAPRLYPTVHSVPHFYARVPRFADILRSLAPTDSPALPIARAGRVGSISYGVLPPMGAVALFQ